MDDAPTWNSLAQGPTVFRTDGHWRVAWAHDCPAITEEGDLRSLNPFTARDPTLPQDWLIWESGRWRPVANWVITFPPARALGFWHPVAAGYVWRWCHRLPHSTLPLRRLTQLHHYSHRPAPARRGPTPRHAARRSPAEQRLLAMPTRAPAQARGRPRAGQSHLITWLARRGRTALSAGEAPTFRRDAAVPEGPAPPAAPLVPATEQWLSAQYGAPGAPTLLLATDFSGLDAPAMALVGLAVPFTQAFACDIWRTSRRFLHENYVQGPRHQHLQVIHRDVRRRRYDGTRLDLYVAGPPCQAFSPAGKRRGEQDPLGRGQMFGLSIKFIIEHLPRVFVLENSHLILTYPRGTGAFLRRFRALLEAQGYQIHAVRMDTHHNGLPQFRQRGYIIGIHHTVLHRATPFAPPAPVPAPPAACLLNPATGSDNPERVPARDGEQYALQVAQTRLSRRLAASDWFVDIYASAARVNKSGAPRALLPALLHARDAGVWIAPRGRKVRFEEAARFQGILAPLWDWTTPEDGFRLLGNTMSLNVLQRLLVRLLPFITEHRLPDPWEGPAPPGLDALARDAARPGRVRFFQPRAGLPAAPRPRGPPPPGRDIRAALGLPIAPPGGAPATAPAAPPPPAAAPRGVIRGRPPDPEPRARIRPRLRPPRVPKRPLSAPGGPVPKRHALAPGASSSEPADPVPLHLRVTARTPPPRADEPSSAP